MFNIIFKFETNRTDRTQTASKNMFNKPAELQWTALIQVIMKCRKTLQKAKNSHKQVKKSKLSFTNHNTDRYSPKSPSWYESTSKGNNFFQHAYLCSNLSFCHKTGSCFQNIEKIFWGSINYHIKIPYTKFQVSMSFGLIYRLF